MKKSELLKKAHMLLQTADQAGPEYDILCFAVFELLPPNARDVLAKLVEKGPVSDEDIPSKAGRDLLLEMGLASKAIVKGNEGFNVANYLGAAIYRKRREEKAKQSIVFNTPPVDEMVDRFLTWRLPATFNPDNGIEFTRIIQTFHQWPTGTNLFCADEAREMVVHMLGYNNHG